MGAHLDIKPANIFIVYSNARACEIAGDIGKRNKITQVANSPDSLNFHNSGILGQSNSNLSQNSNHSRENHSLSHSLSLSHRKYKSTSNLDSCPIFKIGDFGHVWQENLNQDPEEGDKRYLAPEFFDSEDYSNIKKADIF